MNNRTLKRQVEKKETNIFINTLQESFKWPPTAIQDSQRWRMDRYRIEETLGISSTCPAATDKRATRSSADVTGLFEIYLFRSPLPAFTFLTYSLGLPCIN